MRKRGIAKIPNEIIVRPQLNRETRRLLKLARIEPQNKALRLQFDNDMQNAWFRNDDNFPVDQRGFQFIITVITLLALLTHFCACSAAFVSSPYNQLGVRVLLMIIDMWLILCLLKIELPLFVSFYEMNICLKRVAVCGYVLVTAQLYPYDFKGDLLWTIVNLLSSALSGSVIIIWAVQYVILLTCLKI